MIPVQLQTEPSDFDKNVRQKGHQWLARKGIPLDSPPQKASELPAYWRKSNKQLWDTYHGICAYLAIFFEWETGASSTDHFIPKSKHAGGAYEWDNFRLSCLGLNRDKSNSEDILDPIKLKPETFILNLASGKIRPNPSLTAKDFSNALKTIKELKLNTPTKNLMRARHYGHYISQEWSLDYLKRYSPFIYTEVVRQNLI